MLKVAVVLHAGTEGREALGRMANALATVKEFKKAGDDVKLIFDGAGVLWIGELAKPEHQYHEVFEELRGQIAGVCDYCANAFGVTDVVKRQSLPFSDEHEGHPSFRQLLKAGYQVLSF